MALTQISTQGIKDGTITGSDLATNVDLVDNQKLRLGTGNDLQIYHSGAHSYIEDSGPGTLAILTNSLHINNAANTEAIARFNENGAVELYYDNSKKLETTSGGATVTGNLLADYLQIDYVTINNSTIATTAGGLNFTPLGVLNLQPTSGNVRIPLDNTKLQIGAGQDLEIYHNGSHSFVTNATGFLSINTDNLTISDKENSDKFLRALHDGAVELYYDNSKKLETTTNGITVTGGVTASGASTFNEDVTFTGANYNVLWDKSDNALEFAANAKAVFASDLTISHTGDHGNIVNTDGNLNIKSQGRISFFPADNNDGIIIINGGAVELYHDNSKKFETTSGGVLATGDVESSTGIFEHTTNFTTQLKFNSSNETQLKHLSNGQVKLSFVGLSNAARGAIDAQSGFIRILTAADETGIICRDNSSTDLHFDGSKKLETTSTGVTVTGTINFGSGMGSGLNSNGFNINFADSNGSQDMAKFGASGDLQIYHDGSHSRIDEVGTGNLKIQSNNAVIISKGASENLAQFIADGAVELYHDNSKKFETQTNGITVTGGVYSDGLICGDSEMVELGNSGDLQFYHDGTNTYLSNSTGYLYVQSDNISLAGKSAGENYLVANLNGAVQLYYDSSKKFETLSNGIRVQGGVLFGSDTAAANALDDYEEGSLNWELAKSSTPSLGTDNGSNVKYVKVGQLVHISGRIRTDSCGSAGGDNFVFQSGSTLPFTPETSGTSVVGHWRSQDQTDKSLTASIAWVGSSTTLYLYTIDAKNDYAADTNNVPADSQTNLVITFSLTYRANS